MSGILRSVVGLTVSLAFWTCFGAIATYAQDEGTGLIGVKSGKAGVYHRPSCPLVKRAAAKSKVELDDAAAAEADGFKPCPQCKPAAGADDTPKGGPGKKGTGGKTISTAPGIVFSRDIAPILINNCYGCHEKATTKNHQFELSSFSKLMKGSDTGPMVVPNKPEESELLVRVKGELPGGKMPPGNNNDLAVPTISKLEEWIKGGAVLDAGYDQNANLRTYAPTLEELRKAEVGRMSNEQREGVAETEGRKRIQKATSESEVTKISSPHFVLLSNLPKDRGDALVKALERHHTQLKGILGPSPASGLDGPIKLGVYVFKENAAYAEFVRGVENRELESGVQAHANFNVEAPYLVAVDPLGGGDDPTVRSKKAAPPPRGKTKKDAKGEEPAGADRSLEGLLAEQLAVAATTKAGKAPRWLSIGLGAYFASQVDARSRYVSSLRVNAFQQNRLNWGAKVGDALRGETDPDSQRAIGFSLMEWLNSTQRGQFGDFIRALVSEGGEKLDDIIKAGWGDINHDQFVDYWGGWVQGSYARVR